MEVWELVARESIRDVVARYNANGDTGRFAQVLEQFAPDAVMEFDGRTYSGHDEILTIFTGTKERAGATDAPQYLRHMTATLQIDLLDRSHATSRCYYQVLSSVGLDHWGRYLDEFRTVNGRWVIVRRRVTVDGISADSRFSDQD